MATWNMGQYDSIENDARRMDEIEYTRQRQAVLDKRAAQDYALRYESDKRKAAREKAEFDQYMRTLPAQQNLADMKLQNELNALKAAQQQQEQAAGLLSYNRRPVDAWSDAVLSLRAKNGDASALSQEERDLIEKDTRFHFADKKDLYNFLSDANEQSLARFGVNLKHLPYHIDYLRKKAAQVEALKPKTPLQQLTQDVAIGRLKGEKTKQENIASWNKLASTSLSPFKLAVLKLMSNGGDYNTLSKEEYNLIAQNLKEMYQYTPDEQDFKNFANATPEQLQDLVGIDPELVKAYTLMKNGATAKSNTTSQTADEQYKTASSRITGEFNAAVASGAIDPKKVNEKNVVDAATRIYNDAKKQGQNISFKDALNAAAGIKPETMPRSDLGWIKELDALYGGRFRKLKTEKQKEVIDKAKEFEKEVLEMLQTRGIQSWGELPLDELRLLDRVWQNSIDDDDLYSPFQNQIFLRERDDLYAQKFPLIKELRQLEEENTMDYYDVNSNIRVSYNPELAKKVDRLKTRIDNINDAIKMREKKLSARGIKFKEYK